jgi:ElaB/YqjD/DUF883 family membrane-anchored ribosome-binding protein
MRRVAFSRNKRKQITRTARRTGDKVKQRAVGEIRKTGNSIQKLASDMSAVGEAQIKTRPWTALGIAAGVGFLIGAMRKV